jgi:tRNA1Val (adenine37-N6)-methyltransferase
VETIPRIARIENHEFTYVYAQTPDYRFCQDSIIFARFVADTLRTRVIGPDCRALDICSGSGVIGLELAHHEPRLSRVDFMEIQGEFEPVFAQNLTLTGRDPAHFRFLRESFAVLRAPEYAARYDLIVANPPYFFAGEGPLSKSSHQNRCRFFLDGTLRELVLGTANALALGGDAYLLVKSGQVHGRDAFRDLRLWLAGEPAGRSGMPLATVEAEIVADIRGTLVVRISKTI